MNANELKTLVYQQIEHLDDAQLKKLHELLDQELSQDVTDISKKRVGGKYKGQFIIKEDFDQMPDDFMSAFTKG